MDLFGWPRAMLAIYSAIILRVALVMGTFNQRKNAFIKAADLARHDYQLLVLARKLSLPDMRSQRVLAAGLTQLVQGMAKCRSLTRHRRRGVGRRISLAVRDWGTAEATKSVSDQNDKPAMSLSFTVTLSDGRQYTLHRKGVIPLDAVEVITGPDYAIYCTEALVLLACYCYGEEQADLSFTVECQSVEEAKKLVSILKQWS
jgi:hypothetical protein